MNIYLNKKPRAAGRAAFGSGTPIDGRSGFFAVISEVHPETGTVSVVADTGIEISGVDVASREWVVREGGVLAGERNLPPVGAYVYCAMPSGRYEESFVLCSMFSMSPVHGDYREEGEDAAATRLTQESGGWLKTTDRRTGAKKFQNRSEDPTITVEIGGDEEKATLTVHGSVLTVTKDGIDIRTDGKISVSTDGDAEISAGGNAEVSAGSVKVTGSDTVEIHGGQVKLAGTVTPKGSGSLCAIPYCAFSGAPQAGDTSLNA